MKVKSTLNLIDEPRSHPQIFSSKTLYYYFLIIRYEIIDFKKSRLNLYVLTNS